MREAIGDECNLMVDANQFWGVDKAKAHVDAYRPYNLKWGLEFVPEFLAKHQFPAGEVWRNRDPIFPLRYTSGSATR